MKSSLLYPKSPSNVPSSILEPSEEFRSAVMRTIIAILSFIAVYLLLVLGSIVLAVICGYIGVALISQLRHIVVLMLGVGMIGLGIAVIFFMIKFIFARHKADRSNLIEVDAQDQPELITFISNLAAEVGTSYPKKIYFSADVNATVFYDSSFLSMFFPVEKNLQIGLGLVNSVTVSELKAIIAHEFGHFSQRSMALGNYVYNVNKIIFNMLFDNQGYTALIERWGNASTYFSLFAMATMRIVEGIQYVLNAMYGVVNKSYLGLSRQMEFHADAVAASVAGSEPLITSLRRLEAADICYSKMLQTYTTWIEQNIKSQNIYPQHTEVMFNFGSHFKIPIKNDLLQPLRTMGTYSRRGRINIKNQWASHPSTDEREDHLHKLNIASESVDLPAWVLFRNVERLQQQMTDKIYEGTNFPSLPTIFDTATFKEKFIAEMDDASFHPLYKEYYDGRDITEFDPTETAAAPFEESIHSVETLFAEEYSSLPMTIESLKSDISMLEEIKNAKGEIRSFDFDGKKYTAGEAVKVLQKLRTELDSAEKELKDHDMIIFKYFYRMSVSKGMGNSILNAYNSVFAAQQERNNDTQLYNDISNELRPIYVSSMQIPAAINLFKNTQQFETKIQARVKTMVEDGRYTKYYTEKEKETLIAFYSHQREYLKDNTLNDEALTLLNEALHIFIKVSFERSFRLKKGLLELQLS